MELTNLFTYEMPKDPANKSAISLSYYIPLDDEIVYSDGIPIEWYDNNNLYFN